MLISAASPAKSLLPALLLCGVAFAAPPDRILRPIDAGQTAAISGNVHRLAAPQFDQGPADPQLRMNYIVLVTKPSAAQQADLDRLLADQQNPSSPQFHKWLTPDEFGNRFGLSSADHAKIAAWLKSEGFTVNQMARGRNWVAFSGTAAQVSKSLHTSIHRYLVNGQTHFANSTAPSVPAALADVTAGFMGLTDFKPKSNAIPGPAYTSGKNHYLAPADFAAIYNVAPLYTASGLDGTGVNIAIVGESDVALSDLQSFKKTFGLPANTPKMINYDGVDPGFNGAEIEGDLDLEWSSAIAPNATIYYVYGADPFEAAVIAIDGNYAPIISISYSDCEVNVALAQFRSLAQQGNAQGITILAASGDSGAAGCDDQDSLPFAENGEMVNFPAVMPEVTAVGGTTLNEGSGTYWSTSNSSTFGSALSYIPETAWNESSAEGLAATGGGASLSLARPAWQTGPGVPMDNARHVPDVAFTAAASHDPYFVSYAGNLYLVGGTSCGTPSMAGIVALLNQYQVKRGFQSAPGLGNINPQLYRLAQSYPSLFHDTQNGNNIVSCAQGSIGCLTGSYGYNAGAGYDMATGLGSLDANDFVGLWNTATKAVTVSLSAAATKVSANGNIQLSATVTPASGSGTPTGTVAFSVGGQPLATSVLAANGSASATFPAYLVGTGTYSLTAEYSGDAAFSSGGASTKVQITTATGVASIIPSAPNTVWPILPDAFGLSWETTITLYEVAGTPAMLTGFTIDGQTQPLAQYFPSTSIPPDGSVSTTFVLRNQAAPLVHVYGFTGIDLAGNTWSRQVSVNYNAFVPYNFDIPITAAPQTVTQNVNAPANCQWPVQIHLDNLGGYLNTFTTVYTGYTDITNQFDSIFGTTRIDAYGSLSGTLCFGGITPPATLNIEFFTNYNDTNELNINFAGPPANPAKITAAPASITLTSQATLSVGLSDQTQPWTASIYPANRTTSWLTVSQLAGTGTGQIALTANGAGFEPGVYRASVVIQSINAIPQSVTVPVMFVNGGSTSGTVITGVGNAASFQNAASPGMLLTVVGNNLANTTATPPGASPIPYATAGVSATVNGIGAPLVYVSPTQLNIQIPYTAGAGPAVVGINNNGQIAGYQFNIAPAAPGIFADAKGNLVPSATAQSGAVSTLYLTGVGEVPSLDTGFWPSSSTPAASLPKPILPVSVTVGGMPAFLQFYGLISGALGTAQVNFNVPGTLTPGTYPVVVTVGGVSSPPVNLNVTAPTVVITH